jgi:hypothetical protein
MNSASYNSELLHANSSISLPSRAQEDGQTNGSPDVTGTVRLASAEGAAP